MPYESKDARLIFTTQAERDAHDRAVEAANRQHGSKPAPGQNFDVWDKAWVATFEEARANG